MVDSVRSAAPHAGAAARGDVPGVGAQIIDARARFRGSGAHHACRECGEPGTVVVLPRVDHRRKKPWPEPYWLCSRHSVETRAGQRASSRPDPPPEQDNEPGT